MLRLSKILLFLLLVLGLSFNTCYGIDENITNNLLSNETDNTSIQNNSIDTTEDDEAYSTSTTISSASNVSNNSTVTNILIIALIVIGILLILLAIAILIRLGR